MSRPGLEACASADFKLDIVNQGEDCTLFRIKEDSGEGTMTRYPVFPGIDLIFNSFHLPYCRVGSAGFRPDAPIICIDYCREGRIEWEQPGGSYVYLEERDLLINSRACNTAGFGFPLQHYDGITVSIEVEAASAALSRLAAGMAVDVRRLQRLFCPGEQNAIMRAAEPVQRLFAEMYRVPVKVRTAYYRIKVLELLLLLLSQPEAPACKETRRYFPKRQVEAVKAMTEFLTRHLDTFYTLKELSVRFELPLTTMKLCFKGVYGTSIAAYMRSYRMHTAARLLRQSEASVIEIAGKMGYDNASKFAAAFKAVMGCSPQDYRKSANSPSKWSQGATRRSGNDAFPPVQ